MNKLNNKLKIIFSTLIILLISACDESYSPMNLSLLPNNDLSKLTPPISNSLLNIKLSEQIENPQFIGGEFRDKALGILKIMPWLRYRLGSINDPGCSLERQVNLIISVKKFYIYPQNGIPLGTIVLEGKFSTGKGKPIIKTYRGDCKMDFFTIDEERGLRSCFNSSLDQIIPNLKRDLCEIAG